MSNFRLVKLVDAPVHLNFSGGINWQGNYVNTTTYALGDAVAYNDSSYVAIQSTTGNLPTNTTYWQLLAQAGIDGATGATGPAGPGVPTGGSAGQLLSKIDGTDYNTQWIDNYSNVMKQEVKLDEAVTKGQAVYVSGSSGTNILVKKADNSSDATSATTIGLIETTGVLNDFVNVITEGIIRGIDTSAAGASGDPVWLGTSGNLIYGLANEPIAPAHIVYLGTVVRKSATVGEIYVHLHNGWELNELHNVLIASPSTGQALTYDSTTGLWKNTTLAPGGVTSVTGTAPVVSSGGSTPAISMAKATTSVDGYLAATDFTTFNNKQAALGYTAENTANKGAANGYASLDSGGKVPVTQLPSSIMEYKGTWNASTNSPTLTDGTGNTGDVYRVSTAGSQNLGSGSITFDVGDYVIYNGTTWEKSDTTDAVASVAGKTGNVTLTKSDVGLANVDNTSDATKNSAVAALTNKDLTAATNTFPTSLVTLTGTQTLSNKTFTGAKLGVVLSDNNGGQSASFGAQSASAVNRVLIWGADTGANPILQASGTDTNIGVNIASKGTGTVQANGVPIVTTTGTQTLTNKSLTSPTITGTPVTTALAAAAPAGNKSVSVVPMSTDLDSNASAFMPGLHNTLAYNIERGGSVTLTKNGTPVTITNPERLFNGNFSETGGWLSYPTDAYGSATTTDVYEFTVTINTQIPRDYLGIFGVQMAHVWAARDVKIEVFFSGAWTTIYDVTNTVVDANTPPIHWIRYASHGANPISQIRYTLKNIQNGLLRVLNLFYAHSTSSSTVFLRSNGGRLFGTNAAPPTLTAAGSDTNISLNLVPKGTGTLNQNGVPVVTTTGTQTLTNKTLTSPTLGGTVLVSDGGNIDVGSTTGTKIGIATSDKIGFWNATPIVQPTTGGASSTFTANTGTAVNDASTFDGYTIAQVVKALRNAGLLG